MGGFFGKPKFPRSWSSSTNPSASANYFSRDFDVDDDNHANNNNHSGRYSITPFVFKRWSSMYIDEDGDEAHEFYIEPRHKSKTSSSSSMRKVESNRLRPQGYVNYEIPRLNPNIPYIMVETKIFNASGNPT